jgi:AcrR family transcriptional regulator
MNGDTMTMASRSLRAERQARTRETLVATATPLFLSDGLAATSLDRVADEAGFSKGAVYSNFRNKDELCLAVLDGMHRSVLDYFVAAFSSSAGSLEDRLGVFERWADRSLGEPRWTALEAEFAIRARTSAYVADALRERSQQSRSAIEQLVLDSAERFGLTLPMPAEDVATALLSLGVGLGIGRANDPTIPVEVMSRTIRLLLGVPVEGRR